MIDRPFSVQEFAAALLPLLSPKPEALALAVSGGRDSMALLQLSADFVAEHHIRLLVLTVDHGLRAESACEAAGVRDAALARGLDHRVLHWDGSAARGNLEAQARDARYALMASACAEAGIRTLLLGHTLDDQAETFLLRLARGSGVDGLAAMAPRTQRLGLTLLRPLLDVPRARLEAFLRGRGIAWFDDPMNEETRFARVALRKARQVLEEAGLTAERLAATARHMARARLALEMASDALAEKAVQIESGGFCRLDQAMLLAAPEEIGLRLLSRLLMGVGGRIYPPRFERLARAYAAIRDGALGNGRTLGGCRILPSSTGKVLFLRESAALGPPLALPPGGEALWDGRFRVRLPRAAPNLPAEVKALGIEGVAALRRDAPQSLHALVPALARRCLPSLWIEDRLAAVPHLGYAAPAFLPLAAGFEAAFTGV